jgi:primosomal protein N' (replication factor Y)
MTEYIQAAVNVPQISGVFDYHLPLELEGKIQLGCLVAVPFGKQLVQGVVLRFVEPNLWKHCSIPSPP